MKKTLKKYFIPHEENNHKPYFLREKAVTVTALVAVLLLCASMLGSYAVKNSSFLASIQSAFLVDLANEDRKEEGASTLVINDKLVAAAQLKANDMAEKSYFAHTSPEGVTPWHWFGEAGYDYLYAGENLAVNFSRSEDVERAWMNSPLHRANILNNRYKEIGIATAEGMYKGERTTFVVQMFGTPLALTAVTPVNTVAPSNVSTPAVQQTPTLRTNPNALGESTENKELTEPKPTPLPQKTETPKSVPSTSNKVSVKPNETQNTPGTAVSVEEETFIETQNPLYENVAGVEDEHTEQVYTNWFERFLVNPDGAVNKAYVALFVLILFSLILNIFIAIRTQHPKSIVYGVLLLILVLVFMYINQEMFTEPLVMATP